MIDMATSLVPHRDDAQRKALCCTWLNLVIHSFSLVSVVQLSFFSRHAASFLSLIAHPCQTDGSSHFPHFHTTGPTMSYAYAHNAGPSTLPSFTSASPSKSSRNTGSSWDQVSGVAKQWIQDGAAAWDRARPRSRDDLRNMVSWGWRRVFTLANAIVILWIFTLQWGERTVFQESIDACAWESWERWVNCPR